MDPNAALDELRAIAARVRADHRLTHADVERAGELFDALDGWLTRGGYLPAPWDKARPVWAGGAGQFASLALSGSEVGAE